MELNDIFDIFSGILYQISFFNIVILIILFIIGAISNIYTIKKVTLTLSYILIVLFILTIVFNVLPIFVT